MKKAFAALLICSVIAVSFAVFHDGSATQPAAPKPPAATAADLLAQDTAKSVTFRAELLKAMDAAPNVHPLLQRKLKIILNGPDTPKKAVILRYMERHARAHLAEQHLVAGNVEALDWSKIDWNKVLTYVLQILIALLPFLLAL
jgi:hypothetical protein